MHNNLDDDDDAPWIATNSHRVRYRNPADICNGKNHCDERGILCTNVHVMV